MRSHHGFPDPVTAAAARRKEGDQGELIGAGHGQRDGVTRRRRARKIKHTDRVPLAGEWRGRRAQRDRGGLRLIARGRIPHAGAERMQRTQDVCVATQEAGDQNGQQEHQHGQYDYECNHVHLCPVGIPSCLCRSQ